MTRPAQENLGRLLVVDDEEQLAQTLAEMLSAQGYETAVCTSGESALNAMAEGSFDLLLTDLMMPGMDGIALLKAAQKLDPHVIGIVLTGQGTVESAVEAMQAGAFDYILKPFKLHDLLPVIRRARQVRQLHLDNVELRGSVAMYELGQAIAYTQDLPAILDRVAAAAIEQGGADGISIMLPTGDGSQLTVVAVGGKDRSDLVGETVPLGEGIAGWVARHRESVTLRGAVADTRFTPMKAHPEIRYALSMPLMVGGKLVGVMNINVLDQRDLRLGHVKALEILAGMAATAIENATLRSEATAREQELRQSQKMDALGQLAGGIAHDFNNLLTAVLGFGALLVDRIKPEDPLQRFAEEIVKAAERGAALTGQMLAFSRRQVLQPQLLDLNEVVAGMEGLVRRLIGEDIELHTYLVPDLGRVTADRHSIEQVILNLVANARDAMPRGGALTIETALAHLDGNRHELNPEVGPGPYLMLAVTDTGMGIPPETLPKIFEPFFTTKEVGSGTGLGLSTTYGIVKQSNGTISVYSEVGTGTSLKVYLPLSTQPAPMAAPRPPEQAVAASGGEETVLLVEDEEAVRNLALEVLRGSGYQVLAAATGREALTAAEAYPGKIDLLLSDLILPGTRGRTVANRLAQARPDVKVLFMSGYPGTSASRFLPQDAAFIAKPFAPNELLQRVRTVLDTPVTAIEAGTVRQPGGARTGQGPTGRRRRPPTSMT